MTLRATRRIALLAGAAWLVPLSRAQLNVGVVEGSAFPAARLRLRIEGPLGMAIALDTDARGRFRAVLPYGIYTGSRRIVAGRLPRAHPAS